MKKFSLGIIVGLLIGLLTAGTIAFADSPIKLIVNGKEIACDVAPQVIQGRTMVPARYVAEALGAKVEWDKENNAVIITGGIQNNALPTDLPASKTEQVPGQTASAPTMVTKPVPPVDTEVHNPMRNPDGVEVSNIGSVSDYSVPSGAPAGYKAIAVTVTAKNTTNSPQHYPDIEPIKNPAGGRNFGCNLTPESIAALLDGVNIAPGSELILTYWMLVPESAIVTGWNVG